MNENGELLTDFCTANELVIGGTLFPHKECHKATDMGFTRRENTKSD